MWPQPPVARSTIWICAVLPAKSPTSQEHGARRLAAAGLGVGTGGGADDFAVDQQVHAGLALPAATADEEADELPLDLELRRRERAGGLVAAVETVDQAVAEVAAHCPSGAATCPAPVPARTPSPVAFHAP